MKIAAPIEAIYLRHQNLHICILKFVSPSWNTALYMAVYVVLIENELASQISHFNLQSSGILPDSTHTRSILNVNEEEGYLLLT